MSIQKTGTVSNDVVDRSGRQLGSVSVSDSYQEGNYLALILVELRRMSLLLAEIGSLDIDDFEVEDEEVDT